jgi:hypothetical protein
MDEAKAFLAYQTKTGCDVKELAAKFAKSEHYIAHRLGLNTLIPSVQKDFMAKKMNISQAEVFAKLSPAMQKELQEESWDKWSKEYSNAKDMVEHLERHMLMKLDKAPWKRTDETLPGGACSACLKRSGCQTALFDDVATDDRCLDSACYDKKKTAFVIRAVTNVIENKPDLHLLSSRYDDKSKEMEALLKNTAGRLW